MPVKSDLTENYRVINPKIGMPDFLKISVEYHKSRDKKNTYSKDDPKIVKIFTRHQKEWLLNNLNGELPKEQRFISIPEFFKNNPTPKLPIFISFTGGYPNIFEEEDSYVPYVCEISSEDIIAKILDALKGITPFDIKGFDEYLNPSQGYLFGNYIWELKESEEDYSFEEITLLLLEEKHKKDKKFDKLKNKFSSKSNSSFNRKAIPQNVKMYVWRRDEGRCAYCGSRKNLEYDHIIPLSMGGSNTERNIQLLCEKCNREKSDNI